MVSILEEKGRRAFFWRKDVSRLVYFRLGREKRGKTVSLFLPGRKKWRSRANASAGGKDPVTIPACRLPAEENVCRCKREGPAHIAEKKGVAREKGVSKTYQAIRDVRTRELEKGKISGP